MSLNTNVSNQTGWNNIKVALFGRQVLGITAISYKQTSEKETLYGAGREPLGVGVGNNTYEGSITLYRYEVDNILAGARAGNPQADLTSIATFPITVVRETSPGVFQTDIVNAQFTTTGTDLKQNDKMDLVELPLLVVGIQFNA